jgi:hypothetical protein
MSTAIKALLLSAILIAAATATGQVTIVNFDFGAVSLDCGYGYTYEGATLSCPYGYPTQNLNAAPGFGWILGGIVARQLAPTSLEGGAGVTEPGTIFSPPPFTGMPFNRAVFLQDVGSFAWQAISGFTPGNYTLSFYLGSRYTSGAYDGNQTVVALIDGNVIGTWSLSSFTPFTLQSVPFLVTTPGTHALEFAGVHRGDHTAFLSYVVITPTRR